MHQLQAGPWFQAHPAVRNEFTRSAVSVGDMLQGRGTVPLTKLEQEVRRYTGSKLLFVYVKHICKLKGYTRHGALIYESKLAQISEALAQDLHLRPDALAAGL